MPHFPFSHGRDKSRALTTGNPSPAQRPSNPPRLADKTNTNRFFIPCPHFERGPLNEDFQFCDCCGREFLVCDPCASRQDFAITYPRERPCLSMHGYRAIFITSAKVLPPDSSTAAYGVAITWFRRGRDRQSRSYALTPEIDPGSERTPERADLMSVCYGLRLVRQMVETREREERARLQQYLIMTTSHFIMHGMTRWMPAWKGKACDLPTSLSKENFLLFVALDREMTKLEQSANITISFVHRPSTPQGYTRRLATKAADLAHSNMRAERKSFWNDMFVA